MEESLDVQQPTHFARVGGAIPDAEGGEARRDSQTAQCTQRIDDFLRHAFAEVILVLLRTHVDEGQDRHARHRSLRCLGRRAWCDQAIREQHHDHQRQQHQHRVVRRPMQDEAICQQREHGQHQDHRDDRVELARIDDAPGRRAMGTIGEPRTDQHQRQSSGEGIDEPRHRMVDGCESFAEDGRDVDDEPGQAKVRGRHAEDVPLFQPIEELESQPFEVVAAHPRLMPLSWAPF